MESNGDKLTANRMKNRGMSWTIRGTHRMAKLVQLSRNGELTEFCRAQTRRHSDRHVVDPWPTQRRKSASTTRVSDWGSVSVPALRGTTQLSTVDTLPQKPCPTATPTKLTQARSRRFSGVRWKRTDSIVGLRSAGEVDHINHYCRFVPQCHKVGKPTRPHRRLSEGLGCPLGCMYKPYGTLVQGILRDILPIYCGVGHQLSCGGREVGQGINLQSL